MECIFSRQYYPRANRQRCSPYKSRLSMVSKSRSILLLKSIDSTIEDLSISKSSFDSLRLSSPILTPPSRSPQPTLKYPQIKFRRGLFRRIAHLNTSFGARERSISSQGSIQGDDEYEIDLHWEAIERVLFIYAKLNPAIGYVQGMNELIAPLYYVFPPLYVEFTK